MGVPPPPPGLPQPRAADSFVPEEPGLPPPRAGDSFVPVDYFDLSEERVDRGTSVQSDLSLVARVERRDQATSVSLGHWPDQEKPVCAEGGYEMLPAN